MQNEIANDKVNCNYEEIISELEQCREDERNSQNQIIQVIVTAGTILTLIFGIYSFEKYKRYLFHLSNLILLTTFGYITSLGINAVLRYHYIHNLEDKLLRKNSACYTELKIIHWNSFSSSITTKNPKHMYNIYTILHYLCYSLATICPILFCICITVLQFILIEEKTIFEYFGIVALIVFMFLSLLIYFITSLKAERIYEEAKNISLIKCLKKDTMVTIRLEDIFKTIVYFIYPKKKDMQKIFLIILGFLTGIILKKSTLQIMSNDLQNIFIVCFVIEFLLYQARYQWNDIRGVTEDIIARKDDRLPVKILGKYPAIIISSLILVIRGIATFSIALNLKNQMKTILLVAIIMIICCTIVYERARSKKNLLLTFIVVSSGYAIRFCVGLWSAYPQIWNKGFGNYNIDTCRFIICMLMLSYALLGEYSVVLSWLKEAVFQKVNRIQLRAHYDFLYESYIKSFSNRNIKSNYVNRNIMEIFKLWNISYIISMILLSVICLIMNFNIIFLGIEILFVLFSIMICSTFVKPNISALLGIAFLGGINFTCYYNLIIISIFIMQFVFTFIYLFLKFPFRPNFDFIKCCEMVIFNFLVFFIGRDTFEYLKLDSNRTKISK